MHIGAGRALGDGGRGRIRRSLLELEDLRAPLGDERHQLRVLRTQPRDGLLLLGQLGFLLLQMSQTLLLSKF